MTNHILRKALLPTLALALAAGASVAKAEVGVTDSTISFGQAAALEGPASALGTGMRQGILAAFAEANRNGGVGGRQLELKSYDDGYEPEQSISHTQTLINQDQVFALIGAVGTPTASATQPIATEAGVPFIGPFTGAGFLRAPELANVVNVRASYGQETEAWIKHLTEDLGYDRIAILYQDDSFGRVGLDGVNKALQARGLSLVAEGTYKRNTTAVKEALLAIRKSDPQAVVMVGAYKPISEFIKLARKVKMDATFVNISFVGSDALAKELGPDGEGVVITQVVPFPWDNSIPLVQQYQAALKAQDAAATPGFVSLEGYIVGRIAIAALEKAGGELTRESFLKAVYGTGTFDLGGLTLSYGAGDNQGSDAVFLTVIQPDGSFKAVQRLGSSS
jgi:ABC-type branched-subunit amino acid transport system substrate-binding protein